MRMLKTPEITEKQLMFTDYVNVYEPGLKIGQINNAKSGDVQVNREELFKRIQKQRGEVVQQLVQQTKKPEGDLIDVRLRAAGADKKGWIHFSEVINDDKFVA